MRSSRSRIQESRRFWPCVALFCLAAVASCSERPTEPVYDNVFDVRGPGGGDPFEIDAALVSGGVMVTFRELGVDEVTAEVSQYEILYSIWPDSLFTLAGDVPPSGNDRGSYLDFNYVGNTEMFYKVRVRTVEENISDFKATQSAGVVTPPRLRLVAGGNRTQTRFPLLRVETLTDEPIEVASDPSFADAVLVEDLEAESTDPTSPVLQIHAANLSWDLGPGSQGDTLVAYIRMRDEPVAAKTDSLRLVVAFTPALPPLPSAIFDNNLDSTVVTTGVVRMRFADTAEQLPSAEWIIPSANPEPFQYTLSTALDPPRLFAEFEGDFGFTATDSVFFEILAVDSPTFIIDDGLGTTTHPDREVMITSSVSNAAEMRFSESPDFLGVEWTAYEDSVAVPFTLSEGPGDKTIYGWYRNPFDLAGKGTQATVTLLGEGSP